MGYLSAGAWQEGCYDAHVSEGEFLRAESQFRNWVTADGSSGFRAEAGRYHLYVSVACPWAHRALIFRKLKKLEAVISVSVAHPLMLEQGWEFREEDGASVDSVNGLRFLHLVYTKAKPDYSGRVTVPVLWDKQTGAIVNNESSEIIRMLNSEFNAFTDGSTDYYPKALCSEIDAVNSVVYENINNGVYRCGFATTQQAYEHAFERLFIALDEMEARLSSTRYLVGGRITEADWRLFPTLARFDAVYYSHFKCNLRRIADYPNLSNYLRDLYQVPGVAETVSLDHIKRHYYGSHRMINPGGIVPKGPELDFRAPHDREKFSKAANS